MFLKYLQALDRLMNEPFGYSVFKLKFSYIENSFMDERLKVPAIQYVHFFWVSQPRFYIVVTY